MEQFTPGTERPPIRGVPEAVKREPMEKNAKVCFSMLHTSLLCQTQQVGSLGQEVNIAKNTVDPVDFHHNIQCAFVIFWGGKYHPV